MISSGRERGQTLGGAGCTGSADGPGLQQYSRRSCHGAAPRSRNEPAAFAIREIAAGRGHPRAPDWVNSIFMLRAARPRLLSAVQRKAVLMVAEASK